MKTAGVLQANKGDTLTFTSLMPWPDRYTCVEGRYPEGESKRRAGIFVGPEFGPAPRSNMVEARKAEIDPEAWGTLHSDTSRPFPKPKNGRIAVKVINHLGDEVMKVFKVS